MKKLFIVLLFLSLTACTSQPQALEHGDTSTIIEVVNNGDSGYYSDLDFSTPKNFDQKKFGVNYGTYQADVSYYSETIGQAKTCDVILPAHYSKDSTYPVVYFLHGFNGEKGDWYFVQTIYGNLLSKQETVPAILVICDVWTAKEDFWDVDDYARRASYDAFIQDLMTSLMPFVEQNYPVKTGKDNTAIIGMSQGGTEALAAAFSMPGTFGYVGSLAPAPGVIPLDSNHEPTFWDTPILDDLTMAEEDQPYYIMQMVGSDEPWDTPYTEAYRDRMTQNGIPNVYYVLEGGAHDDITWTNAVYNFLGRIFRN